MRRYLTSALIVAASLSLPLTAFAQDAACPPGAWFCQADNTQAPSDSDVDTEEAIPPPPPADSLPVPEEREMPSQSREGRMPPPPVVVYQPHQTSRPSTQIIIIAPGRTHIVRRAAPAVRHAPVVVRRTRVRTITPGVRPVLQRQWRSEWGVNARIQGVSFGGDRNSNMAAANDAGMGGFGLSLRYRPWSHFALDAGFDVVGGTDFNGFERVETPFSVNGILYFNPRSRSQFYVIGGVNWSRATVRSDNPSPLLTSTGDGSGYSADYKYFGGQLGVGLEFRLSKRLAFNVDVLGFIRNRSDIDGDGDHHKKSDRDSDKLPEYMNAATGQTTNTSGGGLFRGGLTLWW